MTLKRVVLDFDGTIANTYDYYRKALDEVYPKLNYSNKTPEELEADRNKSFRTLIKENNIPILKVFTIARKLRKQLGKEVDQIELFPGIKDLIKYLASIDVAISVVSINSKANIEDFLKHNQLDQYISDIWTSNAVLGKKRTLLKLAKKFKLKLENMLYVGDEVRDVETCKKISFPIAAVTWGFNSKEAIAAKEPDYLAENIEQLQKVINDLTSK